MYRSLVVWILLHLSTAVLSYSDYSIYRCGNTTNGDISLYCVGLWYKTIDSLPTDTNCYEMSPCGDKYAPAVDGYIDHIHVDLNPCTSALCTEPSRGVYSGYTYSLQYNHPSAVINLLNLTTISRMTVSFNDTPIAYTVYLSHDGFNWEPVMHDGKLVSMNQTNSCINKRYAGKLIKIIFDDPSGSVRPNASIDIFISSANTAKLIAIQPNNHHFLGCYEPDEYLMSRVINSGLATNQYVNLDQCLYRCTLFMYDTAHVINSVRCGCSMMNNSIYPQPSSLQSNCNSVNTKRLASSVFTALRPDKPSVFITEKINFTEVAVINVTNSTGQGRLRVYYSFGDGTTGEACTDVIHRYRYPGVFTVTAHVYNQLNKSTTATGTVTVEDIPLHFYLKCPDYAIVGQNISCRLSILRGSNLTLHVTFGDGQQSFYKIQDVRYRELGEDPHGKTKNVSLSGAVVLVGYPVQAPGDLMGVEFTLLKPGPMRFMIIRNSQTPSFSSRCAPKQDYKIRCNTLDIFSVHTGRCLKSTGGRRIDSDYLQPYRYHFDIVISRHLSVGYHYIPLRTNNPIYPELQQDDIIVVEQTDDTGTIAKLNETSDNVTALIYPSIKTAVPYNSFDATALHTSTNHKMAVRMIVSELRMHDFFISYNQTGRFDVKANFPGRSSPMKTSENVYVMEKIQTANITIARVVPVGRPTPISIQAIGTEWTGNIVTGRETISTSISSEKPTIYHTFTEPKVYNISVLLRNIVSTWAGTVQTIAVYPVEIHEVQPCWKGVVFNTTTSINVTLKSGDRMNMTVTLNGNVLYKNASEFSVESPKGFTYSKELKFTLLGVQNLSVFGVNGLSNDTRSCVFYVDIPIEGFKLYDPKPIAVNSKENTTFVFGFDKGTNATYQGKLNQGNITISCTKSNCSKASMTITANSTLPDNYTLDVCANNSVTPPNCLHHNLTVLDPITKVRFGHCDPMCVNAMGASFKVALFLESGTDVICDWTIHDSPLYRDVIKPNATLLKDFTCQKPSLIYMTANCSNLLGFVVQQSNFSCLYPINKLLLTTDSPQVVMYGTINFTLTTTPFIHTPTNASCLIHYGDKHKELIENCTLPRNFSHKYNSEGDFLFTVNATNLLSNQSASAVVRIQKPIEIIILKGERSKCDPMYGQPGGGPLQNMFPIECPFYLRIVRMDGSRPNLLWTLGDGNEIKTNSSVLRLQHTCKNAGKYNFTLKAYNDVSSLTSWIIYECHPSVKCAVHEDSPYLTKRPVNITVEVTNHDFLTAVQVRFGDGKSIVIGTAGRKKDFMGYQYREMEPFTGNTTIAHTFDNRGEFNISCNAVNAVSRYTDYGHSIFLLLKPCRKPIVKMMNVGQFANMTAVRNETRKNTVIITTSNTIDCEASRATIFQWNISHYHGPGNYTSLYHPSWKVNGSKLIITNGTLPLGIIRLDFRLRMVHEITGNVMGETSGYFEVLPSELELSLQGGHSRSEDTNGQKLIKAEVFDPDAEQPDDMIGVTWAWYLKPQGSSSTYSTDFSVPQLSSCFGFSFGKLPLDGSSFRFNASSITPNTKCSLKVVVFREQKMSSFEQHIEFLEGPLPRLSISCKANCDHFNPNEILSWEAHSEGFDIDDIEFEWSFTSNGVAINLADKIMTDSHSENIAFSSGSLNGGETYELTLRGWLHGKDSSKAFVTEKFTTNRVPEGGQCIINPAKGSAVITPFYINCFGWQDNDVPLEYRVILKAKVDQFLFSGRTLDQALYLPYLPGGDVLIEVMIVDNHGAYATWKLNTQIDTSASVMDAIEDALQSNGPLLNSILGGNTQSGSQMLSSVASVFIKTANDAGDDKEKLQGVVEKIDMFVDIASKLPCDTPDDVMAISGSLAEITSNPSVVSSNGQKQAASLIDNMLNVLVANKNLASVEMQKFACANILAGLGNVLKSSSMNTSAAGASQAKGTSKSLLSSLGKMFALLTSSAVVGQKFTVINSPNMALLTGVKELKSLSKEPLALKQGSFSLPSVDVLKTTLGIGSHSAIVLKMFGTANPFTYSETASSVETDVLSLSLGTQSGIGHNVSDLSEGIHIEIGNNNPKNNTAEPLSLKATEVATHRMTVKSNDTSLHGVVRPINCSVLMNVTMRYNEYDCTSHHDYTWILPRNNSPVDPYSFYVSNTELNRSTSGSYYICIRPVHTDYVMNNCSGYLNYSIVTFTGSCRFWDDDEEVWKGDNCEVMEKTTPSTVHCMCNHLTSFGGGFFVAPNPIDFGSAFKGFTNLSENFTVFAFVMSVFGIYFILVIWARRADLRDARNTGITILPENDPRDTISYEITVYTGFNKEAGTTADVFLQLIGSLGDSDPRKLNDPKRAKLQRSGVDRFFLTVPQSLGDLREIHVWHNNAGKSPGWFFFKMQIRDCQTEKKWWFVCNKWLAVDEDDGKVERTVRTATNHDLTQFNVLFVNATRRNLFDGHIWLSVYTRPAQSTFTRVQRLSCCLSVLFCTMATNAMFFQTTGGQDTTIKLGPIQLSWRLIMIGIQCSFIVMPVNVLLVSIFRKLAPKEIKGQKYEVNPLQDTELDEDEKTDDLGVEPEDEVEPVESKKSRFGLFSKKETKHPKKKFLFPYWCIYVAYLLCFISVGASSFFTLLYGFQFGREKSGKWLSAMVISLFQSVVVIQPVKVLMLATFFALIIKDPNKEEEEMDIDTTPEDTNPGISINEEEPSTKKALMSKPPDEEKLRNARALRLKERQMSAIIREISLHFMVVILVLFVAYANHDNKSFSFSNQATQLITKGSKSFDDISNQDQFWEWATSVLLPSLYPVDSWLGYPYMDIMHNRKKSNMVGVGRLRQLRNKKNTCEVPLVFAADIQECNDDYSWFNEETDNFDRGWKPRNKTIQSKSNPQHSPWEFQSAWDLKGFPYIGKISTYRGGGYIVELGPTNETAFNNLEKLWKEHWIDKYTRALFTELNVYSVDINLLCVITLLYEFLPSTGGVYTMNVQTIKLFRYLDGLAQAVMGFEFIFLFMTFFWIYRDCKKIIKENPKVYFRQIWNIVDSAITILSISAIAIYFVRMFAISNAIDQFHENRKSFVNFQYVVLINEVMNAVTAFIVLLNTLKFLRLLRFNRKISMLADTLRHSAKMLYSFFVMIFMVVFAFCSMAYLIFGSVLEEYRTIVRSCISLFSMMLGDFDFQNLEAAHRIIGPLMFFFFMLVVQFILVNLFVGILCESFEVVRTDTTMQSNEYEIVEFITGRLQSLIGVVSKPPVQPEYKWPKTVLDKQVESIGDKTDTIISYMRTLGDEDLRTSIWLESNKMNKVHPIISFALKHDHVNSEEELFDSIPILINFMNAKPEYELNKFIRNGSQLTILTKDDDGGESYSERLTSMENSDNSSASSPSQSDDDSDGDKYNDDDEVFTIDVPSFPATPSVMIPRFPRTPSDDRASFPRTPSPEVRRFPRTPSPEVAGSPRTPSPVVTHITRRSSADCLPPVEVPTLPETASPSMRNADSTRKESTSTTASLSLDDLLMARTVTSSAKKRP